MLVVALVGLTGCSSQVPPSDNCAVGYVPSFKLTVRHVGTEPAVRFCDEAQCSPVPKAGPVQRQYIDREQRDGSLVEHRGVGSWWVSPRGSDGAPSTASIELYVNGKHISTTTVHLHWPHVDPCAKRNPPPPHATVTAHP